MQIFKSVNEMRTWSAAQRAAGRRIAFVPTMGALHDGHMALLREGARRCDALVLSIYVNPTQFGPDEDLKKYPRDIDGDLEKAKICGTEAVFMPSDEMMYPEGYRTYITVEGVTKNLCGASRPTHFRGVATVVAKLFNIVMPDVAIFGEKDYQQLVVIRRMVSDLNIPVEIVGHPIVREDDGLAMSSRNKYLSPAERSAARSLSRSLEEAQAMVGRGETDIGTILEHVRRTIESTGIPRVEYAKIVDADTIEDLHAFRRPALPTAGRPGPALLAVAAQVGPARLIDNRLLV